MPSEARQKKIMEKLNRAQKCSILGPQNLGSGGARAPGAHPLDLHLERYSTSGKLEFSIFKKSTDLLYGSLNHSTTLLAMIALSAVQS